MQPTATRTRCGDTINTRVFIVSLHRRARHSTNKLPPEGGVMDPRAAPVPPPAKAGAAGCLPAPSPNPPWESPVARWGSKVPRGTKSRRAEGRERLSWLSSGVVGSSPPPLERGRTCARATYGRVCEAGEAERQPPWGRAQRPVYYTIDGSTGAGGPTLPSTP